jgi:hypothetical protein
LCLRSKRQNGVYFSLSVSLFISHFSAFWPLNISNIECGGAVLGDSVPEAVPLLLRQVLRGVPVRAGGHLRQQGLLPLLQQLEDQEAPSAPSRKLQ